MTTYRQFMDAVNASDLKPTPRNILKAYAYHANWKTGQNVRPSQELIAQETGLGVSTVEEHTPKLVKAGWLTQISSGRGGNSNRTSVYRLSIPGQTLVPRVSKSDQTPDDGEFNPQLTAEQTPGAREQQVFEPSNEQTNTVDGPSGEKRKTRTPVTTDHLGLSLATSPQALPSSAPSSAPAPGPQDAAETVFSGNDEEDQDNREWLSEELGVPVDSIGSTLWRWLDGVVTDSVEDTRIIAEAAKRSKGRNNPAGYFRATLSGMLANRLAA